jgi:tetratricopeptide (TPR) repeat protein
MSAPDQSDASRRLSVAMIVRDAAETLPASLQSVAALADEIVVLDTGSTDATSDVARRQGAVVHQAAWQDSFAAARNECLRHVTGDWVLWLDAGETLDATAARQLPNFLAQSADRDKAYLLFIERPALQAAGCTERVGQVRLHARRPELKFTGRLREQLLPAVVAAGLEIDALDCAIDRTAMDHEPRRHAARAERNLRLADLALADDGERPAWLAARAEALAQLGRHDEAQTVYRRLLEIAERGSSEMLEGYYGLLTTLDSPPDAAQAQIAVCLEALEVYPLDAQLLCGMGNYLLREERLDLAARSYELAVRHGQVDPATWHLTELADVAATCLSLVHQLQGNAGKAIEVLRDGLAERPESARLRRQIIELYIKSGHGREAIDECKRLPFDTPYRDQLSSVARGAALTAAGQPSQGIPLLAAAYESGCRDTLCLRWLATAYATVKQWDEFEATVAEWELVEPGSTEIEAIGRLAARGRDTGRAVFPTGAAPQPVVPRPKGTLRPAKQPPRGVIKPGRSLE